MRGGRGGKAGIAAASALLTFTLVAPPLLSSSATSAALQTSLANACPADVGLLLNVEDAWLPDLTAAARDVDHAESPIVTRFGSTRISTEDGSERAVVLSRDDAVAHLPGDPVAVTAGTLLVPDSFASTSRLGPGDELILEGGARDVHAEIGSTYPDVPVQPEPGYWCGVRELLRPSSTGGSPVLLADDAMVRAASDAPSTLWELDPDIAHLTEERAETLQRQLEQLASSLVERSGTSTATGSAVVPDRVAPELDAIIEASRQHGDAVRGSMIGARMTAFAFAIALLVAATWLLVRQSRDELTIRAIRGEGPGGLGVRVAERGALPVVVGIVVGLAAGFAAVRTFGPSTDIDSAAGRRALLLAAVGLVLAVVIVGVSGGRRADGLVDRQPRQRRRPVWPWELVPIVLAFVGLARLDRIGGLQVAGAPTVGSDALAQAFPVFGLGTIAAVLVRPARWLYAHARRGERRSGPAGLLGWRRLGADAGVHALLTGATILAVGASLVAGSVVRTVERAVENKSTTFLGSDLRVVTADEPVISPSMAATPVSRASARSGDTPVTILGIDPDTFASAVYWHEDSSGYTLAELLHVLEVDDMEGAPLPAVLVGGRLTAPVFTTDGEQVGVDLNIIATADSFPGKTGEPLLVVNRDALAADEVPTAQELWLRDPPPDAVDGLAAAGNTVRGSQTVDGVFDPAGTDALRWSIGVLWPFAVLVVIDILVAAGILLGWRRPARRPGWALRPPIGEPRREEFLASLVALGIPVVIGTVIGGLSGWGVAHLVTDGLDTIDSMTPRATLVVDLVPAAIVVFALLAVVVGSSIVAATGVARVDPLEVSRDDVRR